MDVCVGTIEQQFQIITYTFSPLNIFSIFSLSFATYNKPNRSQITTGKGAIPTSKTIPKMKWQRRHLSQFKQLLDGFTSRLLPRVIQKDPLELTATKQRWAQLS